MEKHMTDTNRLIQRLPLGRVVATPGALKALEEANQNAFEFLERHQAGDWGELCEEDKDENEFSVRNDFRILKSLSNPKRRQNLDHHRGGPIRHDSLSSARILTGR
jgi:hypothetical protein